MGQTRISLFFSAWPNPELISTSFSHPLLANETLSTLRASTTPPSHVGTFKWSTGVHALTVLLVSYRLFEEIEIEGQHQGISGGCGSPAATLDYSLSKKPQWLFDMFGASSDGACIAARLFSRINSERKRPGPVTINVNEKALRAKDISIYIDGDLVESKEELTSLHGALTRSSLRVPARTPRTGSDDRLPDCTKKSDDLTRRVVAREITETLLHTDIFDRYAQRRRLRLLVEHASFQKLASSHTSLEGRYDSELTGATILGKGIAERDIRKALEPFPLRIACPACDVGTLAILHYLKDKTQIELEIDYQFVHGIEIVDRICKRSLPLNANLVLLGIAQVAYLHGTGNTDFGLLTELPGISLGIARKRKRNSSKSPLGSAVFLLDDLRSNSAFYLRDAETILGLKARNIPRHSLEPLELASRFASSDCDESAVMFFPYLHFNLAYNQCEAIQLPRDTLAGSQNFLLAESAILADKQASLAIIVAIRNAWLTLCENPQIRDEVADSISNDLHLREFMHRAAGARYFMTRPPMVTERIQGR